VLYDVTYRDEDCKPGDPPLIRLLKYLSGKSGCLTP
jgi:hypothetical protein